MEDDGGIPHTYPIKISVIQLYAAGHPPAGIACASFFGPDHLFHIQAVFPKGSAPAQIYSGVVPQDLRSAREVAYIVQIKIVDLMGLEIKDQAVGISDITIVSAGIVGLHRLKHATSIQVIHVQYPSSPNIHAVVDHQRGTCPAGPHGSGGILDKGGHPLEIECLVVIREFHRIYITETVGGIVISLGNRYCQIISNSAE